MSAPVRDVGPTGEELRDALVEAAGWVSGYLDSVGRRPVLAQVEPGEIAARLPQRPPAAGEPLERMLDDIDTLILPGITHWNHPAFFAYFGITGSGPGIVGELIASALNVNAMLWRTSPAATELEQRTLAWVLDLLGLPEQWFGQITDTASTSTLYALAAAREAAGLDIRVRGMAGRSDLPPLAVYTSAEAHSSVEKACIALGIGQQGLRKIDTDGDYRMRADLLAEAIARRPGRRRAADRGGRHRRHHLHHQRRSGARDRRHLRPPRPVAACGRGLRRRRRSGRAHSAAAGRLRAGRLAGVQSSQMAVHTGRLQPALHVPPAGAA